MFKIKGNGGKDLLFFDDNDRDHKGKDCGHKDAQDHIDIGGSVE